MFNDSVLAVESTPAEYRAIVNSLFPPDPSIHPSMRDAQAYARSLAVEADFKKLTDESSDLGAFLGKFKKNFALLVEKTWVEQADEIKKETLLARLPAFFAKIKNEDYALALRDFNVILEELAYLLFGEESRRKEFTEYAFRIDPQMGLFWLYGACISRVRQDDDTLMLRPLLMLGICYLTSF
jgi:hypothetical protein